MACLAYVCDEATVCGLGNVHCMRSHVTSLSSIGLLSKQSVALLCRRCTPTGFLLTYTCTAACPDVHKKADKRPNMVSPLCPLCTPTGFLLAYTAGPRYQVTHEVSCQPQPNPRTFGSSMYGTCLPIWRLGCGVAAPPPFLAPHTLPADPPFRLPRTH